MARYVALLGLICFVAAGTAVGYPIRGSLYDADEIIVLPPPNPDYTNYASGTIDASNNTSENPLDYTIVVENDLNFDNWKEWLYDLTYTYANQEPNGYHADFHIDYSVINPEWDGTPATPQFLCTDYWGLGYPAVPQPGEMPLSWRTVGFPLMRPDENGTYTQPVKVNPADPSVNAYLDMEVPPWDEPQGDDFDEYFWWNPEWVSLEFYGWGFVVDYEFTDWCIPEPMTVSLLALGGIALLRRRR